MPIPSILFVFGTRAELFAGASLFRALCAAPPGALPFVPKLVVTGQERTEMDQALDYLGMQADMDLGAKAPHLAEAALSGKLIDRLESTARNNSAAAIAVFGSSASAWAAGVVAYFRRIPLIHGASGIFPLQGERPFPEWFHQQDLLRIAALHFCEDEESSDDLRRRFSGQWLAGGGEPAFAEVGAGCDEILAHSLAHPPDGVEDPTLSAVRPHSPRVLIFVRRREHHADGLVPLCRALGRLADQYADHEFIVVFSLQPYICDAFTATLPLRPNLHAIAPLPHPAFVREISRARLIVTDSAGAMREAAWLKRPIAAIGPYSLTESLLRRDPYELATCEMEEGDLQSQISRLLGEPAPPAITALPRFSETGALSASALLQWWQNRLQGPEAIKLPL